MGGDAHIYSSDSEEDYWNYEFTVYQKNILIQNYVADLEKKYFKANSINSDSKYDVVDEKWQVYFEELKKDLVEDEDFVLVN